ncbi:MAG: hypothetical protein H5U06_07780 [Candidatus Aminicenantes bacterium]|nr:hypothetical protein [Candidatus Aminicenantes bacterium]
MQHFFKLLSLKRKEKRRRIELKRAGHISEFFLVKKMKANSKLRRGKTGFYIIIKWYNKKPTSPLEGFSGYIFEEN